MIFLLLASHPKSVSSSINNKRDVNLIIDLKMVFFVKKKKIHVRKLQP